MFEVCAICQEDISGNGYTIPECSHRFHLDCIILWWRSPREMNQSYGSCPVCKQVPNSPLQWGKMKGRVRLLKRLSRKKTAHPDVKKAVVNLKRATNEYLLARKKHADFRKRPEVKNIMKNDKKLNDIKWNKLKKVDQREYELASFDPIGVLSESLIW